jgi:enamine deaminase RidA (YjgF/YER057c/UK114 family)
MTILAAILLAAASQPGAREQATTIMPDDPQMRKIHEDWGFSQAIVVGETVHVSGVVIGAPRDRGNLLAAYERGFTQIGDILKRAGSSWDDVVEITSYHTDVTTQMRAIIEVKNHFVKAPFPAWTAVEVSRLIPDRGITEIKVTARIGTPRRAVAPRR